MKREKHKWIVLQHPDHSPAIMRVDRITGIEQVSPELCLVSYGRKYVFKIEASLADIERAAEREFDYEDLYDRIQR